MCLFLAHRCRFQWIINASDPGHSFNHRRCSTDDSPSARTNLPSNPTYFDNSTHAAVARIFPPDVSIQLLPFDDIGATLSTTDGH